MKLLSELLPILLFFIAYKSYGIYCATSVAMGASLLQLFYTRWKEGVFKSMQLCTAAIILACGGATLFFHNDAFIKWKPTLIYWIFSAAFWMSHWIGEKTVLFKRLVANAKLQLPHQIWRRLNNSWAYFFLLMGGANLYVALHFETQVWVNFKLFGTLGLTLLFMIWQAFCIAKHTIKDENGREKPEAKPQEAAS